MQRTKEIQVRFFFFKHLHISVKVNLKVYKKSISWSDQKYTYHSYRYKTLRTTRNKPSWCKGDGGGKRENIFLQVQPRQLPTANSRLTSSPIKNYG